MERPGARLPQSIGAVTAARQQLPRTVWALGLVSLFMDASSEIVHSLLPVFLTVTLGASVALVGLIDGISEATASVAKVFSGYLSDRMGRRKPLILIGYGLGALTKPLFALAGSPGVVLAARFADRTGKGLRGSPRDALVADVTPDEIHGRAYGLRQALDTVGAVIGPLAALALMALLANDIRTVFWFAAIPGALAVLTIVFFVREEPGGQTGAAARPPVRLADVRRFERPFWGLVAIGVVFTMARFSEAFLVLKASAEGLPLGLAPLVLVAMSFVYALGAYPAGALADRMPARTLLLLGLACLIAADLLLGLTDGLTGAFAGIGLWGAHMALTQGLFAKLVAGDAPADLRGSAFGVFNLATGAATLAASVVAGVLWDAAGASATFLAGAGFATLTALVLLFRRAR